MAHQAFISYGHQDKLVADAACARLEARGVRCWIAPRDVLPGQSYGEAISNAIRQCRVLVLVFSNHANLSEHVSKEVERAVSNGVPVVPLRIEDVMPTGALDYFIGSVHWLDALTPPLDGHLARLADAVERLLGTTPARPPLPIPSQPQSPPPGRTAVGLYAGAAAMLVVLLGGGFWFLRGSGASNGSGGTTVPEASVSPSPQVVGGGNAVPTPEDAVPPRQNVRPATDASRTGIVGCWVWFNSGKLRMESDGRISGTPFSARWRADGGNRYSLHWPMIVESVVLGPDGRSATGSNNFGLPSSGQRVSFGSRGTQDLAGVWQWNGGLATFGDDGSIVLGPLKGRWSGSGGSAFTVSWPNDPPVDQLTMSADGGRLAGQNQFGVKVSGNRVACES